MHKDQKITGMHRARAVAGLDRGAGLQHVADRKGDLVGQLRKMVGRADQIDRVLERAILGFFIGLDQGPQVYPPRQQGTMGDMGNLWPQGGGVAVPQRLIDKTQDGGGRAERMLQFQALKQLIRRLEALPERRPLVIKGRDVSALKGIDRLLLIAHHKHRPRLIPRTLTGGKLGRQQLDHPPLRRAGVLRLIHQNMVDPAIQPVQNPGGNRWIGDQIGRFCDQVVKVQPAARGLARLIKRQEGAGKSGQRRSLAGGLQGHPLRAGRLDPRHQVVQLVQGVAQERTAILGRKCPELGPEWRLGLFAVQQHAFQRFKVILAKSQP